MTTQWVDITEEIKKQTQGLKMLSVVLNEGYTLQDSMQAHEINDPKIDPKHNISPEDSIGSMLKNNKIRLPQTLSIKEIRLIYKKILRMEMLVVTGNPLPQTIYTFAYLFDKSICKDHLPMKALIQSINTLGSYIYECVKESCQVKEDDIGISTFSYNKDKVSHDQAIQLFTQVEKQLQTDAKNKAKEEQNQHTQLIAFIRLRKSIHSLCKSLGKNYDNKNLNKIQNDVASLRKILAILDAYTEVDRDQDNISLDGIFQKNLCKTLRTHFNTREIDPFSLEEALKGIRNTLSQLQLFIPVPTKISEWRSRLQMLQQQPLNLWAKSYIKVSLLVKDGFLFNTVKVEEALVADIDDWITLRKSIKDQGKFKQLIQQSSQVITEMLYRLLGNSMRWQFEISKSYDDYNYIIYIANDLDSYLSGKKQLLVCSWFYYYGIRLMIRQMLVGFKIQMYEPCEYPYVLYYLESLLGVFERNSQYFLKKMDKQYITAFLDNTLFHKRKKKFDSNVRKMFTDTQFFKGLHYYVRAIHRILAVLHSRGHITDPFSQKIEIRSKNRFRIFKNIAFLRKFEFEEFKTTMEQLATNQKNNLEEAIELLKQAKTTFQSVTNLEESDSFFDQRKDSEILMKLCVQASLVAMTLKMGQKKKFLVASNGFYPYIQMS